MAIKTINQLEKEEFTRQGGTSDYLQDLRMYYYGLKTSTTPLSPLDRERFFLKKMTGSTLDSMNDLWRIYLNSKGVEDEVSLGDMKRRFWEYVKFQGNFEFENIYVRESVTVNRV